MCLGGGGGARERESPIAAIQSYLWLLWLVKRRKLISCVHLKRGNESQSQEIKASFSPLAAGTYVTGLAGKLRKARNLTAFLAAATVFSLLHLDDIGVAPKHTHETNESDGNEDIQHVI